MEVKKETETHTQAILTWGSEKFGNCEADFLDGEFKVFVFRENRCCHSPYESESGVHSRNLNYLKELYKNLGELLEYLKNDKV